MSVIDEYLGSVPEPQRAELERVRRLVLQTVPEPEEVISYGMPVIKYKGKYVIGFAPFKDHLSIFPGAEAIKKLQPKLGDYKMAKGTIQFGVLHSLPDALILEMVAIRLAAITKNRLNPKR